VEKSVDFVLESFWPMREIPDSLQADAKLKFAYYFSVRRSLPARGTSLKQPMRGLVKANLAKFQIGQIVRHRIFSFRGVIFDVDPEFNNTEEWWLSIPEEVRPHKNQPFYHLLAENSESEYVAYVSEQNLLPDDSTEPLRHSQLSELFIKDKSGSYHPKKSSLN
jgi:heat shock protein HspQ